MIGKRYYDLLGTIELMSRLWQESVVDGFEFQNLAEWDDEEPPREQSGGRLVAWNESQKYTIDEIAALLQKTGLPILSVHGNRDVGICLCSNREDDINRARRLNHESLYLAESIGAPVCVCHLWDTWKENFEPNFLQNVHREIAAQYSHVKASVENVPTHLSSSTIRKLSSRVEPTAHQAIFTYSFGDFRGDTEQILARYFDAMLYLANWGTKQLMFRIPKSFIDLEQIEPYCLENWISYSLKNEYVILDLLFYEDGGEFWVEGEGWLSSLVSLRDDIMSQDYRVLCAYFIKECSKYSIFY